MTALFQNFIKSESGAVTVDWVVLTAALVGLGLAVMAVVGNGINTAANTINDQLATTGAADWNTIITLDGGTGTGGGTTTPPATTTP